MSDKSHVGMANCFFCGEPSQILLHRQLRQTLPRDCGVINMVPCSSCEALMRKGVILITIDPDSMQAVNAAQAKWRNEYVLAGGRIAPKAPPFIPNPIRTGGWFVVSDAFVDRVFDGLSTYALKHRWMFIAHEAAEKLGLFEAEPTYKNAKDALAHTKNDNEAEDAIAHTGNDNEEDS